MVDMRVIGSTTFCASSIPFAQASKEAFSHTSSTWHIGHLHCIAGLVQHFDKENLKLHNYQWQTKPKQTCVGDK
jgi:uncharacterized protein YfaT (DUF1175 family)